jgi:histidinol-phosphate aminotransferase
MNNARKIYEFLAGKGIIVRDRSKVILCDDCLRITIGTGEENKQLLALLNLYKA